MKLKNIIKKPSLLFDMDSILADLLETWLDDYNQATGESVQKKDIVEYELEGACKNKKVLYDILHAPGFFLKLNPMPYAVEVFKKLLEEGYDISVVTQPPHKNTSGAVEDKILWIKKHIPEFDLSNMFFCFKKEKIHGDVLLDDKPENLKRWHKKHKNGLIATLDWGYNQNIQCDFRGSQENGWLEFYEWLKTL